MNDPKTLLVSQDNSLREAVGEVIASTRGFRLEVATDIESACNEILVHDRMFVILVHLDGRTNVAGLTQILQVVAQTGRPMVTIVISEHGHPEQALTLARLGVAECLSRPLDMGRLSYLIDVLTLRGPLHDAGRGAGL